MCLDKPMHILRIMESGHKNFLKTLENLPEEQWTNAFVTGSWTIRDIVAHLATSEALTVESFQKVLDPLADTPLLDERSREETNEFNAARLEERKDTSGPELLAEYTASYEALKKLVQTVPAGIMTKPDVIVRYGAPSSLEDLIALDYGHKRHHLAQIKLFRQQKGI